MCRTVKKKKNLAFLVDYKEENLAFRDLKLFENL